MNNLSIKVKGVLNEGSGLLKDNWVRAFAVVTSRVLGVAIFLMVNKLISTVVADFMFKGDDMIQTTTNFANISEYLIYYTSRDFLIQDAITLVLAVFFFMFISPLTLGCTRWYNSLAQCENLQVAQIFHFYRGNERFVEALVFELNRLKYHVTTFLVSLAPAAICLGYAVSSAKDKATADNSFMLFVASAALAVIGLIVYALWILRYFLAKYLMVSNRGLEVAETFKTSAAYMKGMHGKVLKVFLSFIPMFLLCIFFAPAFFVLPLYDTTMAACAQDIIDARTPV